MDIKSGIRAIKYAFKAAPVSLVCMMLLASALCGPITAVTVVYTGRLIDAIAKGMMLAQIVKLLLACAGFALLSALCVLLSNISRKKIGLLLEGKIKREVLTASANIDYLTYISREHKDEFGLAQDYIEDYILFMLLAFMNIIGIVFAMLSYIAILGTAGGGIAVASGLVSLYINSAVAKKNGKERLALRKKIRNDESRMLLYQSYYSRSEYANEMAIFATKPYFDDIYEKLLNDINKEKTAILSKETRRNILLGTLSALIAAMALIGNILIAGPDSIGLLTVVITAVLGMLAGSASIGSQIAEFGESAENVSLFIDYIEAYGQSSYVINDSEISTDETEYAVKIKNLSFSFGDINVFHDINLSIRKGQTVAFVGENGVGKTTLANLILGMYPSDNEHINVFGKNPYEVRNSGKSDVAAVFQQFGKYYGMTLEENIAYDKKVNKVELGNFDGFFANQDLDEIIGDRFEGTEFSGGQWQKIALARCIGSDAKLILMDEPTAALDPMAEMEIFDKVIEATKDKTCILITHRLGAVRRVDKIFAFKDGKIIETGNHEELMNKQGYYYDMFMSQAQWYDKKLGGVNA